MNSKKLKFIVLLAVLCFPSMEIALEAQTAPADDFIPPLEIPLILSGNYGEIRSTHFHAGLDFKTQQVEGKRVLAARDGYIARISVQSGGYGHALYIAHPGGFLTVYGHLREFMPEVEAYVKENQYRLKSFEVNLFPEKDRFSYNQGELIGYSGNTGSSTGPHLHFEIRNLNTSVPLNVLKFNMPVTDDVNPRILWLAAYPLDDNSLIDGRRGKKFYRVVSREGRYTIDAEEIRVTGKVGFGIETYDYLNGAANRCSPDVIDLAIDGRSFSRFTLDEIPFDMTSYVNSHIDYEEKQRTGRVIQKLFLDPNNKLKIYQATGRGIIDLDDSVVHDVRVSVADTYGNEALLDFKMRTGYEVDMEIPVVTDSTMVALFGYNDLNVYENDDVQIVVPEDALYDDIYFTYEKKTGGVGSLSDTFVIHNIYTPLHRNYILAIKAPNLPPAYRDKVIVASADEDGNMISRGGEYREGIVTTRIGSFGRFFLAVDTINPVVSPVQFKSGGKYAAGDKLHFKIVDYETGIRNYNGYIDGKWTLFTYDGKYDLFTYEVDPERLVSSENHQIEIIVTDNKDNTTHFTAEFYY